MDFVGEDVASEVSISAGNPAPNSVATKVFFFKPNYVVIFQGNLL